MYTKLIGRVLAIGLFTLAPASAQQRSAAPAPGDAAYAAWKAELAPRPARATAAPEAALTTPGCDVDEGYFVERDGSFLSTNQGDDSSLGPIALGFTFELYGDAYDQLYINANGNVTFNARLNDFTPEGFPIALPMVAPYWADWDFRAGDFAEVYYKLEPGRLTVIWEGNPFPQNTSFFNQAQLVLTDGTDPLIGVGNNVGFAYEDMQWYTGSIGDAPATVGVNSGDGSTFAQIGLFGVQNSEAYDGAGGARDGVDYLDCRRIQFGVGESASNIPPVSNALADGDEITVQSGQVYFASYTFGAPEVDQSAAVTVTGAPANFFAGTTPGNLARVDASFAPDASQEGQRYDVTFTAEDDGVPSLATTVTVTFVVEAPVPEDIEGGIDAGTCVFPLPSGASRCFLQLSGANGLPIPQRYTVFLRLEGTDGATSGVSRVINRGEIKLRPFASAESRMAFRTGTSDPDGSYDIVMLAEMGSVPLPTVAALELDRFPFTKGGAGLRASAPLAVYPNPASGAATLRFAVAAETEASLVIYDALGREVARPIDGLVSGGVETTVETAALPAGLYVARLVTAAGTETVRFSVAR